MEFHASCDGESFQKNEEGVPRIVLRSTAGLCRLWDDILVRSSAIHYTWMQIPRIVRPIARRRYRGQWIAPNKQHRTEEIAAEGQTQIQLRAIRI